MACHKPLALVSTLVELAGHILAEVLFALVSSRVTVAAFVLVDLDRVDAYRVGSRGRDHDSERVDSDQN